MWLPFGAGTVNSILFLLDCAALDTVHSAHIPSGQHCHAPSNLPTPRRLAQARGAQGPRRSQGDLLQGWAERDQPSAVHIPLVHINEVSGSRAVRKTKA